MRRAGRPAILPPPMMTDADRHPFALDAYDLRALLGKGAMGEVWRGVHRGQGAEVAIKILTGPLARKPQYRAAFEEEVRAVAMLDHPHIVAVYDYGRVTAESSRASGERYPPGSPYLVMELVDGGSMVSACGRSGWPTLYKMLYALLDALGHAHARGLVHRDLKPHNVLVPHGPGVRLTDFGLAHALYRDEDPFRDHMAGTPNYMAPEQIRCEWRDYGPPTDLYAVGCIAYALVTGTPPFRRIEARDTLQAHLYTPPPPVAREGLPEGFEAWVHRLLDKDPGRRFQRAADAVWALMKLAEGHTPGGDTSMTRPDLPHVDSDPGSDPTEAAADSVHTLTWRWDDWSAPEPERPAPTLELPNMPADWRRDEEVSWNPLLGVGLGLYGLRTVPLVDRYDERDNLWAALRAVRETRRPRAVVLRGPAGMGKSRLATWIGERAHELGVATVLRANHNLIPGARDGLGAMLARHHVCQGLDRDALIARLEGVLRQMGETREDAWRQLATLIAPDGARLSSGQRYAVLEAHLRRLAARRAVVMLVDDAQWGPEAVDHTRRLLDAVDLPLLVVLTVEEANRSARAGARHVAEKLSGHAGVSAREIGSLPVDHRRTMVQALLGLDSNAAAIVETRTEGNPLFAIHLVGDWVQRRALVPAAKGFRLREDVAPRLPDGIHDIWRQRIDEVLATRPSAQRASDRRALELAAMLGRDVDHDEWCAAAGGSGESPAETAARLTALRDVLIARRLAVGQPGEPGWSFAHGMLQESVKRRIAEGGRDAALHAVCAAVLDGRAGQGIAERRAVHLIGAGRHEAALGPLVRAASERGRQSNFDDALRLLDTWAETAERVGLDEADPRWIEAWVAEANIHRRSNRLPEARALALRIEEMARRHGYRKALGRALVDQAWDAVNRGEHDLGVAKMDEVARIAAELDDRGLMANCRRNQGVMLLDRNEPERVEAFLREALRIYDAIDRPVGAGLVEVNFAQLARRGGRYAEALAHLDGALSRFETRTDADTRKWTVPMARAERGLVHFERGHLDLAEAELTTAVDAYGRLGGSNTNAPVARLNLARLHLARGHHVEAHRMLADALRDFAEAKRHGRALLCVVALLECAALERDWATWDEQFRVAVGLIEHLGLHTRDVARQAEAAAARAAAAGERARAADARALAAREWQALGAVDEVERLRARHT